MNAEQKELFRLAILRVLDANRTRFGLGPAAVGHALAIYGFGAKEVGNGDGVQEELEYLSGKELVEEVRRTVSRENRCWRITADGIAFLDERS